jgi:polyisoprenoid-binding protein YceI
MTTELSPGRWVIAAGSTASFGVGNFGRVVHGTVPILRGTLTVSGDGRLCAVHGELDLAAIDTGTAKRDLDLRKPRLLDLDAHPKMTFRADSIEATGIGWRVNGHLTARGRTAPITGEVRIDQAGGGQPALTATARLDRRLLGIRAPRFLIGRSIDITVTATVSNSVRETAAEAR